MTNLKGCRPKVRRDLQGFTGLSAEELDKRLQRKDNFHFEVRTNDAANLGHQPHLVMV
jgi:hypothetical protein